MKNKGRDILFTFVAVRVTHEKSSNTSSTWVSIDIRCNAHMYLHNSSAQLAYSDIPPLGTNENRIIIVLQHCSAVFWGVTLHETSIPRF